jgi:sortase A
VPASAEAPPAGPLPPAPAQARAARPLPPTPAVTAVIVRASSLAALLAAWFVFYTLALSALPEARSQQVLYGQFRAEVAMATAPLGGGIAPGSPVALLEVPSTGLSDVVVEGTTSGDLRAGPGHRRDSPLPGQAGVCVIYGHGNSFGSPFRRIGDLSPGEKMVVTTGQGTFAYIVDDVRRAGDPLPPPLPPGGGRITLVAGEGAGWRSSWAPNRLVYVDASLDGDPLPAPPGRPVRVPADEGAMQPDPDALLPLSGWLLLLGLVAVAGVWAQSRWSAAQAWLVGTPMLLAVLWLASETAARLLPNNF